MADLKIRGSEVGKMKNRKWSGKGFNKKKVLEVAKIKIRQGH